MKKLIFIALAAAAIYRFDTLKTTTRDSRPPASAPSPTLSTPAAQPSASNQKLSELFTAQTSGRQIQGEGRVTKLLPDDQEGSRHQRFIIQLGSGQTLLVAHNIDLASRVKNINAGDRIEFNGVYEWNEKGGVIHWTHKDPKGRHEAGWILHKGRKYQRKRPNRGMIRIIPRLAGRHH